LAGFFSLSSSHGIFVVVPLPASCSTSVLFGTGPLAVLWLPRLFFPAQATFFSNFDNGSVLSLFFPRNFGKWLPSFTSDVPGSADLPPSLLPPFPQRQLLFLYYWIGTVPPPSPPPTSHLTLSTVGSSRNSCLFLIPLSSLWGFPFLQRVLAFFPPCESLS